MKIGSLEYKVTKYGDYLSKELSEYFKTFRRFKRGTTEYLILDSVDFTGIENLPETVDVVKSSDYDIGANNVFKLPVIQYLKTLQLFGNEVDLKFEKKLKAFEEFIESSEFKKFQSQHRHKMANPAKYIVKWKRATTKAGVIFNITDINNYDSDEIGDNHDNDIHLVLNTHIIYKGDKYKVDKFDTYGYDFVVFLSTVEQSMSPESKQVLTIKEITEYIRLGKLTILPNSNEINLEQSISRGIRKSKDNYEILYSYNKSKTKIGVVSNDRVFLLNSILKTPDYIDKIITHIDYERKYIELAYTGGNGFKTTRSIEFDYLNDFSTKSIIYDDVKDSHIVAMNIYNGNKHQERLKNKKTIDYDIEQLNEHDEYIENNNTSNIDVGIITPKNKHILSTNIITI